jgi:hypothetical protein
VKNGFAKSHTNDAAYIMMPSHEDWMEEIFCVRRCKTATGDLLHQEGCLDLSACEREGVDVFHSASCKRHETAIRRRIRARALRTQVNRAALRRDFFIAPSARPEPTTRGPGGAAEAPLLLHYRASPLQGGLFPLRQQLPAPVLLITRDDERAMPPAHVYAEGGLGVYADAVAKSSRNWKGVPLKTRLIAERDKLNRAIEALQGPARIRERPTHSPAIAPSGSAPARAHKRPRWTAAKRKAATERAKTAWAKRRKEAGKNS